MGKTLRSKTAVRQMQKAYAAEHPSEVEIAFLLQDWSDAYNVGGMFRVADALGCAELALTGNCPAPPDPMIGVTSMGAHRRVRWTRFATHDEAIDHFREQGFALIAVEIAEGAASYLGFDYPAKVCLVLGNEQKGVYGKVMKRLDGAVFIPMAGKGRSINVHVAAAVVGFEARLGRRSDSESVGESGE